MLKNFLLKITFGKVCFQNLSLSPLSSLSLLSLLSLSCFALSQNVTESGRQKGERRRVSCLKYILFIIFWKVHSLNVCFHFNFCLPYFSFPKNFHFSLFLFLSLSLFFSLSLSSCFSPTFSRKIWLPKSLPDLPYFHLTRVSE